MECADENKTGQFTENVYEGRPRPQPLPMQKAPLKQPQGARTPPPPHPHPHPASAAPASLSLGPGPVLPLGPKGAQHGNGRIPVLCSIFSVFVIETGVLEISKNLILKIKVQQISFLYVVNLLWP
mgnify:CR=1 FL=1